MKSLYFKTILTMMLMALSSLSIAGLITMEAKYDSITAAEFSWSMTLDEAGLNTQLGEPERLNSSWFDFVVSLNVVFKDHGGAMFFLNLDELKSFDVSMRYSHLDAMLFVADGTNQKSKVRDINFVSLSDAFLSKGTDGGVEGHNRGVLSNVDDDEFRLSSFKSVSVPEPSTLAIFMFGIIAIGLRRS